MKKFLLLASIATLFLASCSDISEEERFTYVKPAQVNRAVLIEDFTGQRCVNCPKATDEIHALQEQYGDSAVIAVGIHSGPFAKSPSGKPYALYTETGDTYYNYWNIESQPMGIVNRMSGAATYDTWSAYTRMYLETTSDLAIEVNVGYNAINRKAYITTYMDGRADITGMLQLWVVEDSIQAFQYQPDGSNNRTYIHNHVFRAAVNGDWGEDVTIKEGYATTITSECVLDERWDPTHTSIVAFVYDDNGVHNVTKAPVVSYSEN